MERGIPGSIRSAVAAGTIAMVLAGGCAQEKHLPRLVLLFMPCTVNASFLSPYNGEVDYTPNLSRFGRDSIVFLRHQSEAGQSGVAYASMLTGRQAMQHRVFTHPTNLPDSNLLIPEIFARRGYETFFWNEHSMASARLNYAQGVDPPNIFSERIMPHHTRYQEILDRVRNDPEYRALIVTNFTLTHGPYYRGHVGKFCEDYPQQCRGIAIGDEEVGRRFDHWVALYHTNVRQLEGNYPSTIERLGLSPEDVEELTKAVTLLYKSNINRVDTYFGRVIDEIYKRDLADRSLVVFTADHGETMNRDQTLFKWTHGWELAPEVLRVPLILRMPGLRTDGGRFEGVTRSIDLLPTLAGLAGLGLSETELESVSGVDLSKAVAGRAREPRLLGYSHTTILSEVFLGLIGPLDLWRSYHKGPNVGVPWVAIRDVDMVYKFRNPDGENWGFQVFDLREDPDEADNLYDESDEGHRSMADRLLAYQADLIEA